MSRRTRRPATCSARTSVRRHWCKPGVRQPAVPRDDRRLGSVDADGGKHGRVRHPGRRGLRRHLPADRRTRRAQGQQPLFLGQLCRPHILHPRHMDGQPSPRWPAAHRRDPDVRTDRAAAAAADLQSAAARLAVLRVSAAPCTSHADVSNEGDQLGHASGGEFHLRRLVLEVRLRCLVRGRGECQVPGRRRDQQQHLPRRHLGSLFRRDDGHRHSPALSSSSGRRATTEL